MRLTSEIFCSALVRSVFAEGGFAAISSRGTAEAGAIYIVQRLRDGSVRLFGPAPQSYFMADDEIVESADSRRFEQLMDGASELDINERLERERGYDGDIWVVELETDQLPEAVRLVTI